MLFTHLSEKFYNDYPSNKYPEMMLKENRPYTQVITEVNGLKFAVPLRSDVTHKTDVLWTDKQAKHGLDFTKAVLILDDEYISGKRAYVRDREHQHLLGKERRVKEKMEKCISNYCFSPMLRICDSPNESCRYGRGEGLLSARLFYAG